MASIDASFLSVGDYLRKPEFGTFMEENQSTKTFVEQIPDTKVEIVAENGRLKEENLKLQKQVKDLELHLNRKTIDLEHF